MKPGVIKFVALASIVCMVLFSCATSTGALFKTVVAADKQQSAKTENNSSGASSDQSSGTTTTSDSTNEQGSTQGTIVEDTSGDLAPGLSVVTTPVGASVYLNGDYQGDTPITLELDPGTYRMVVRKMGYYSWAEWISYQKGTSVMVRIPLSLITGFLNVRVTPKAARVAIDGNIGGQGVTELPIGSHELEVKLFGYESYTKQFTILQRRMTDIQVTLQKAKQAILTPSFSRQIFDPNNPGKLGTTKLNFQVTTSGSGSVVFTDEQGKAVRSFAVGPFTSWNQSVVWNGRDDQNDPLPDGSYKALITAKEADAARTVTSTLYVKIDSTAVIAYRDVWSGTSGLMYAPTAETLPPSSYQIAGSIIGHYDTATSTSRIPSQIAGRFSPIENGEVDAQGTLIITGTNTVPFSAGLGFKYRLLSPGDRQGLGLALQAKATYVGGTGADTQTNYTGLSAGVDLMWQAGPLAVVLAPEVIVSPFAVNYSSVPTVPSIYSWAYGRAGLLLDFGSVWAGVSAAVRTLPFSEITGISSVSQFIQPPLAAGAEVHWLLPNTLVVLSGYLAGEFTAVNNYYLMAGAGVGIIQ